MSARTAWQLLSTVQERAPEALESVLADPTVMAWALRLSRRLGRPADGTSSAAPLWADLGQFHALAAAAALLAGVPCALRVPAHRGMVWLPGAGMAGPVARRRWSEAEIRVDAEGAVVRGERGNVSLHRARPARVPERAPGWFPLRRLRAADGVTECGPWLDMVSPYRDFTRYPRSPDRMDDRRFRVWETRLADAYALLDRESPAEATALGAMVRALVPRSFSTAEGGLVASASSLDAFGLVTLSLPHDETQTAAILVHETRHQQLNALLSLVKLVRIPVDADGTPAAQRRLHFAPWRSDPRPVRGLLHGVFAFAGVGRFWLAHRGHVTGTEAQRADFEFAVLREQLGEAVAALLGDEDLTEEGRLFVGEVARTVAAWEGEDVAAAPAALARHHCALRRAVWRARHLELPASVADRFARAWTAGAAAPELPPSTLRPRPELIRPDTFGSLARLRLSAPTAFTRRRRRADSAGEFVLRAGAAAVAGDAEEAVRGYARWAARDPSDPEAWIGAALALPDPDRSAGTALLLERPEAVRGVLRALEAAGDSRCPAPGEIAGWLGGSRD
ncbi:aKG-HExxH-type peptide beta-hydroxylase [Streptomyces sp. NPDC090106]|uniref:aKG-HExxH-type peptide beta-hydroxylase n=1 Tax=Streptomyces sp. NPDC090106 TaxID=3365946 RepID=UPI0037F9F956